MSYSAQLSNTGDPVLIGDWFFLLRSLASVVRVLDVRSAQGLEIPNKLETVPAAHIFIHAATSVLERSEAGDRVETLALHVKEPELAWRGDLYKLSRERWTHWKKRWSAMKDSDQLEQNERKLASLALDAMKRVE